MQPHLKHPKALNLLPIPQLPSLQKPPVVTPICQHLQGENHRQLPDDRLRRQRNQTPREKIILGRRGTSLVNQLQQQKDLWPRMGAA